MERYLEVAPSGSAPTAPAANPGYPTNGNPSTGTPASEPGEWWFHMISEELRAVILAAGGVPDHTNLTQVRDAMYALFGRVAAPNTWAKANRGAYVALSSTAGNIAVDLALSNNYKHTFTENTILAAPTNAVAGQAGVIELTQHATLAKTLAYNTFWKFANGLIPVVTTTLGGNQKFFYVVDDGGASATCILMDIRS